MSAELDLLAGLVLDDGRRWGGAAAAWQWADARAILKPGPDDPRLHWLGRPKGGSKSTDLAALTIVWLLEQAPSLAEGFAVAADEEQANRLLDRARGLIARTAGLSTLKVEARRIVNTNTGARVQALAADVAGSEGLLSPWLLADEGPNWASTDGAKAMWTSIVSAVPKWPGCRLVAIGHAGDPAHWFHKVVERARVSPAWRVSEVPGPLPWIDAAALEEQKHLLLPSQYARRHLNLWVAGEDRLATRADVLACATLEGPGVFDPRWRYVVAADLGVKRDRSVVVVAHLEPGVDEFREGRRVRVGSKVVVDRKLMWKPSATSPVRLDDVEAAILQAWQSFGGAPIVLDPWQALGLAQRLRARIGSEGAVQEFAFTASSVGRLAGTLFGILRDRRLAFEAGDEELVAELSSVQLRETSPGVIRMGHAASGHDDQAVAVALAAHHLLESIPVGGGVWVSSYRGRGDLRFRGRR